MASCGNREHIISRGDMARIYADMYLMDQWIMEHSENRRAADTSLVYNPIFEKYGYDNVAVVIGGMIEADYEGVPIVRN